MIFWFNSFNIVKLWFYSQNLFFFSINEALTVHSSLQFSMHLLLSVFISSLQIKKNKVPGKTDCKKNEMENKYHMT